MSKIISIQGDIFYAQTDAITNPVNCVGVMGAGLALQFKRRMPVMFNAYSEACRLGTVYLGRSFIFHVREGYVVNFPTKGHWRDKSNYGGIYNGLIDLVQQLNALNVKSIAFPPLGCGLGGLDWRVVREMVINAFSETEIEIHLYEQRSN